MARKRKSTFTVHVKADVLFEVSVQADTFEEALAKGQSLKFSDVHNSPVVDAETKMTGIYADS